MDREAAGHIPAGDPMTPGALRLHAWRTAAGWTLDRVAQALGTDRRTVGRWEDETQLPSVVRAVLLSELSQGHVMPSDWLDEDARVQLGRAVAARP